jgi:hypothetical protein
MKAKLALWVMAWVALAGCGGGGLGDALSSGSGRVPVSVDWSDGSRDVSANSASVVATLSPSFGVTASRTLVLNRPTAGTVARGAFESVPRGSYRLVFRAFALENGFGAQVAEVAQSLEVTGGPMKEVALALAGQIHAIVLPEPARGVPLQVPTALVGYAVDAEGRAVLLPPGSLNWSVTSKGGAATITDGGVLVATAIGEIQVTLAEPESGKHAEVTLNVVVPPADPPGPPQL